MDDVVTRLYFEITMLYCMSIKEVISMVIYLDFYIDTKTCEIHQFGCNHIPAENNMYLGIYRNTEIALIHAKSKGFINASICNSCRSS